MELDCSETGGERPFFPKRFLGPRREGDHAHSRPRPPRDSGGHLAGGPAFEIGQDRAEAAKVLGEDTYGVREGKEQTSQDGVVGSTR